MEPFSSQDKMTNIWYIKGVQHCTYSDNIVWIRNGWKESE